MTKDKIVTILVYLITKAYSQRHTPAKNKCDNLFVSHKLILCLFFSPHFFLQNEKLRSELNNGVIGSYRQMKRLFLRVADTLLFRTIY